MRKRYPVRQLFLDLILTIPLILNSTGTENRRLKGAMISLNIHELEQLTGVTRQNIRFYEKKGLLHPVRNAANNYREYTEEDLNTLKMIKLLRKLDFSLEEIRRVLEKEIELSMALEEHLQELQKRQQELSACITVCKSLLDRKSESPDLDEMLDRMDRIERKGGKFMSIMEDYKQFAEAEGKKKFSFKPDTMVQNPEEFTEALAQYADANHLNLVLIKGGMYPTFELDGVEYTAHRAFDRLGATIYCTMTRPEEAETGKLSPGRKIFFRFLHGPYLFLIFVLICMAVSRRSIGWAALVAMMIFPYLIWLFPKVRS